MVPQKKDSQVTSKNDSVEDVSQATEESSQLLEEEDNDASEVVLRKRVGAQPNIPTASSPSADVVNSSIHMSLSINPVVEPEKSNKVSKTILRGRNIYIFQKCFYKIMWNMSKSTTRNMIFKETSKKPEWLAELSRKQQHRKSEKFIDHSKRPVVDNTSLKPTRHSMAPFGIHSLNRQGGIGNRDLPTSSSSDNLEDLTSSSSSVRPPINRLENIESTSVNGMINSRTKPILQPAPEKPHVPLDKPHIPSKPISAAFNKDSGATNENIGNCIIIFKSILVNCEYKMIVSNVPNNVLIPCY